MIKSMMTFEQQSRLLAAVLLPALLDPMNAADRKPDECRFALVYS